MDRFSKRNSILKVYLEEVIKSDFPGLYIPENGEIFSENSDKIESIRIDFSKNLSVFRDSVLEYKGKREFLHFTSIYAALNILKTGVIRQYDFNHLSDEQELKFPYEPIEKKMDEFQEKCFKEKLFCFSMIENRFGDIYDNALDYYWNEYADKGRGVCLKIELEEDNWRNCSGYLLGKMQYGERALGLIQNLIDRNADFYKEHNVSISDFGSLIQFICAFYKEEKHAGENEVRLLRYEEDTCSVNKEINNRFKAVGYTEIPINEVCPENWNQNGFKQMSNTSRYPFPQIMIKEIYMGRSIPKPHFIDCINLFSKTICKNGYDIKIKNRDQNKQCLIRNIAVK